MGGPSWSRDSRAGRAVVLVCLGVVYFVAGKLGLELAYLHPSATPVWPPAGITLAALLLLGPRVWPAIFAGAFLVNLTTVGTGATSLGIALGNTLEGLVGAFLVERWAAGSRALERPRNILKFSLLAAGGSTTLSATCGVTSLALGGFASWSEYSSVWLTWWLGDAAGILLVAPPLLLCGPSPGIRWRPGQRWEAAALAACLVLVGLVVFGGLTAAAAENRPLEFVCIPFLLWAAFRFGAREASVSVLLLAVFAIHGTLRGLGPFARATPNESLLLLQAFLAMTSVMNLVLAAVVTARREMEQRLREMSVRDGLTGLANYRHLLSTLEAEIQRSQRTERPFAVLFLDVDGLKRINDAHGHLVGSRSLCRLAQVLRSQCRVVDTAARYGGDEFAVVLPEADETAAWQFARRVREELALDPELPAISVSLGVSVYPAAGPTPEAVLGAADRALYDARSARAVGRG